MNFLCGELIVFDGQRDSSVEASPAPAPYNSKSGGLGNNNCIYLSPQKYPIILLILSLISVCCASSLTLISNDWFYALGTKSDIFHIPR